jgi:Na+-driven multidrug efflux pump
MTANAWNLAISLVLASAFSLAPHFFLGLFTRDPGVHRLGVPYLRVLSLCLPFVGLEIVTAEAILASGHTIAISAIYTTISLLRLPLAFLIPRWTHTGVVGIAWLITVTSVARTVLILAWAARGSWKQGLMRELASGGPDDS